MKQIAIYKDVLKCQSKDEVFNFLIMELKETIKSWDYFVNWQKVSTNISNIEIELNILNTIVGKENPKDVFIQIALNYPNVLKCIPILLATRESNLILLNPTNEDIFNFENFSFNNKSNTTTNAEALKYAEFLEKSGFFSFIQKEGIKNLVDYVAGIEVGLDSNGRKNRSGTSMENITERFVKSACETFGFEYITQATSGEILRRFNEVVVVDKNERRFDFAIYTGERLFLIETNYYGGGGSKLKATAGEYKALSDYTKIYNPKCEFIWITDGKGWLTAKNPLREAFEHIDYIFNLEMLQRGVLDYVLNPDVTVHKI